MRATLQRVTTASVTVDQKIISEISNGLLIFLGIEEADNEEDIKWLSNKIVNLRIFNDSQEVMNLSLLQVNGAALVISQFTLHASTKKEIGPVI
tara:strand:+ start:935 stop:1216 length:282 start_codon:yes stop_codon:yes gene_type:complete